MKSRNAFFLACISLVLFSPPTFAAATLASPDQDRQAKQAVPASGKALIYVYRLDDGEGGAVPALWLNGRVSGNLEMRTYGMWAAGAGRLDIRAGQVDAKPLSFSCQAGRVYFVQLTVNKDQSVSLRQVAYGVGRTDLQQARLVLDPTLAARAAVVPKPVPAPVTPPVSVKQTPAVREAPAPRQPPVQQTVREDDEPTAASGVTLIFKLGSFTLASDSQTLLGSSRSFSAANLAYGVEGEWHFQNGFAIGVELFGHGQEYTTAGATGSGDMTVVNALFNAKKYFRPAAVVQPYVGVGFGSSVSDFSPGSSSGTSGITGTAGGFAVQGMAGVAFRWRHVGIYSEFKYVRAETEATDLLTGVKETVDVSGTGLFAGMNVHF